MMGSTREGPPHRPKSVGYVRVGPSPPTLARPVGAVLGVHAHAYSTKEQYLGKTNVFIASGTISQCIYMLRFGLDGAKEMCTRFSAKATIRPKTTHISKQNARAPLPRAPRGH